MKSLKYMLAPVVALAITVMATPAVRAQLVVEGETISDAKTFDAAKKEGALVVYGVYPADVMGPILKGFETDTGISTEYVRLPTSQMFNRVSTEFAAGKLEADFVDLADPTLLTELVARNVFAPHRVPTFNDIPPLLKEVHGRYYTWLRVISSAIVVNTARVKEQDLPKTLKDLLDPKWQGAIGFTNITAGGSSYSLDAFMRDKLGEDYRPKMAALQPKIYSFLAPMMTDVIRGEIAVAIGSIAEVALNQIKTGAPIKLIFPADGVSVFPAMGGVTSSAKRPNAAGLFLDWLTSKRGGKFVIQGGGYALNPGAGSPQSDLVAYPALDKIWNIDPISWVAERDQRTAEWLKTYNVK